MLKLIGCICVLVSSFCIGMNRSEDLKRHLESLEELKKIFCILRSELEYTRAPFSELFEKMIKKVSINFAKWLHELVDRLQEKSNGTFVEIWSATIEEQLKTINLSEEDLQELKSIGKQLEYINQIDLYIERLEYKIIQTRKSYQSKRKLWKSLGIMGGIFLVILLL